jgi:asparagine synthase (glutamine-hydrolysing)
MPGIAGIISQRPPAECERLVQAMTKSMVHEKFYLSGTYSAPDLGVYAGWVALDQSFAAVQPFTNQREDIALLFSGECFFDDKQDSLIALYEREGEGFFEKLNGLFSGLLIDKRRKRVMLFNDRYGFDRIYLYEDADATYFANEAKALLRILPQLRAFDQEGVIQYLAVGCTLENRTLFRNIQLLPAASIWSFEAGKTGKNKYFSPAQWESQSELPADEFEREFQATMQRIVPKYFRSDAPLGISLTGGLDGRMLLACRAKTPTPPVCYTFAGQHGETLDARLANRVAKTCGFDHHTVRIQPDFFSDFATHADRTVYLTDGCFGVLGAHEIYLNRQARHLAPTRLTGVFGGEVLREVSTFKPLGLASELLRPDLRQSVNDCAAAFAKQRMNPVTFAAFQEIPLSIFGSLAACRSQVAFRTPYLDGDLISLAYRAPKALRSSPKAAVHLVKCVDPGLQAVPTDMGLLGRRSEIGRAFNTLFAKATFKVDYVCNDGMPHWLSRFDPVLDLLNSNVGVLGLHKYLRYRRWLRTDLARYLEHACSELGGQGLTFFDQNFLGIMPDSHIQGRRNCVAEINAALTLNAVQRLLLSN